MIAVILASTLAVFGPSAGPSGSPEPVSGQELWDLPTGSRLAYVKVPAAGTPKPTPIVYLHGGPGVPETVESVEYFGRLAQDGYDVYVYEQVGAGNSLRLADPTRYTVEQNVEDLEAVREQIGAERVILIGHSWGSTLAGAYMAKHPERVKKVVFSSPGAIYWGATGASGTGILDRLSPAQRRRAGTASPTPPVHGVGAHAGQPPRRPSLRRRSGDGRPL